MGQEDVESIVKIQIIMYHYDNIKVMKAICYRKVLQNIQGFFFSKISTFGNRGEKCFAYLLIVPCYIHEKNSYPSHAEDGKECTKKV